MRYIKYTTFNSWWRKHAWSMCWFRGVRITGWWRSIIQFETKWKILLKVCYLNLFFFFLFLVFKAPIEKKAQVPIPCHFSIWLGGYLKQACYFIKSSLVLDILEDSEIWCKRSVTCTHLSWKTANDGEILGKQSSFEPLGKDLIFSYLSLCYQLWH